jgi:uncharacterized ion transporter superfamily protein YfcC
MNMQSDFPHPFTVFWWALTLAWAAVIFYLSTHTETDLPFQIDKAFTWRRLSLILAVLPVTIFIIGLGIVMIFSLSVHPRAASPGVGLHWCAEIASSFLRVTLLAFLVFSLGNSEEASSGRPWLICEGMRD